jgi:type IV pilus assembly protein PilX
MKQRLSQLDVLRAERGVVLILVLILLGLLSLLAATSLRNATSTESIAGNVRTTELASQSAEIALRYCESKASDHANGTLELNNEGDWADMTQWDGAISRPFVLTLDLVNTTGLGATYKRAPECRVDSMKLMNLKQPIMASDNSGTILGFEGMVINKTALYLITARGFGPEVAQANATRTRPTGTEVWLQSQIEIK